MRVDQPLANLAGGRILGLCNVDVDSELDGSFPRTKEKPVTR